MAIYKMNAIVHHE